MAIQKKSLIGNMTAAKKAIVATNAVSSPVLAKSANVNLAKGPVHFAKLTKGTTQSFAKLTKGTTPSFAKLTKGTTSSFAKLTKGTTSSFAKLAKTIT